MPNARVPAAAGGLPTRRAALSCLAGAGAFLALQNSAQAAVAGSSAAFAQLARRYRDAHWRFLAAMDAFNRAEIRLQKPMEPEAIFRQPGDLALFCGFHPGAHCRGGRWWYGDSKSIDKLSGDQHLNAAAAERRDEIIDAYHSWRAAHRAAEEAAGLTQAAAEFAAADKGLDAARLPIVRLRSADAGALQLKLRVFADIQERAAYLDNAFEAEIGANGPGAEAFALSIARDLCTFGAVSA